ncbi:hypothetical protein [Phenylobacterium sp.]|uniref:hypothetical protein n=1 Tax=Phenylobacterium sp. TaxID=1871053 RepID=UPI0025F1E50D|nr:hypothetical protein [Phenylobacterium sp.]
MTLLRNVAILALLVTLGGGLALAAPKSEGRAAIVQKLIDCRKLTDDPARLACYDQATAAFDQAEAKGDVVVIDRDQARQVRKQAFGFTLPSISIFAKGETAEEVDTTDGVVASARQDGAGRWVIKLEDGAVWSQVGVEELFKTPKPGMPVKIRKASLGSFLMTVGNQGAFRAHRVE